MALKLAVLLTCQLMCISLSYTEGPETVSLYLCEGQSDIASCDSGKLIYVTNALYGVHNQSSQCKDTNAPVPAHDCVVPKDIVKEILTKRCNRRDSCDIAATDSAFNLTQHIGDVNECIELSEQPNSQLALIYNCLPDENFSTTTAASVSIIGRTPTISSTTALPMFVPRGPCNDSDMLTSDCQTSICLNGSWERPSIDRKNVSCCGLWEGCDSLGLGALTQNSTDWTDSVVTSGSGGSASNQTEEVTRSASTQVQTDLNYTSTYAVNSNITASPLGSCPAENTTEPFPLTWTSKLAGSLSAQPCPEDERRPPALVRRQCFYNRTWELVVDTSNCASPNLLKISTQINQEENVRVTAQLVNVTRDPHLQSGDITAIARIINQVNVSRGSDQAGWQENLNQIVQNVLATTDNALNSSQPVWTALNSAEKSTKAIEIIEAVEHFAVRVATESPEDVNVVTKNAAMKVVTVQLNSTEESVKVDNRNNKVSIALRNFKPYKKNAEQGKLVTVFHSNSEVWSLSADYIVNTQVFSAALVDESAIGNRRQLSVPFNFTLQHKKSADKSKHKCAYWSTVNSSWSGAGCRLIDGSESHSVCQCDHMTNFAVLLDVKGTHAALSDADGLALQVITYAGCGVSIMCLLLSWLTFLCLKNISGDRTTIHKHLVFTLMLAEILFLVALSEQVVAMKLVCSILAGALHFLFLSVFAWTCLEGVQLYIMLIEVFESERSRIWYYYSAGYGLPLVIVCVSLGVDHTGYGTSRVCWLETASGFIWSFAGPVAAVMLVNIIMLAIAIVMMYRHSKMMANMKHQETTRTRTIKAWIKGAVVLVVLLGLTWVFGFMYVNKDSLIFAYLFTILNSLQGLFIFIFHCLCNDKVQKEYKKIVRRTEWLPNCLRVHYGEHKGLSYTTSNSSGSVGYFSKLMSRRRKSTDLSTSSVRGKKNHMSNLEDSITSKEPLTRSKSSNNNLHLSTGESSPCLKASEAPRNAFSHC